jgi:hypothetical protein
VVTRLGSEHAYAQKADGFWVGLSELVPLAKACGEVFAIKRGAYQMALEREVLPDRAEARQAGLSALGQPEAANAPQEVPLGDAALAFTRGLMTICGAIGL